MSAREIPHFAISIREDDSIELMLFLNEAAIAALQGTELAVTYELPPAIREMDVQYITLGPMAMREHYASMHETRVAMSTEGHGKQ